MPFTPPGHHHRSHPPRPDGRPPPPPNPLLHPLPPRLPLQLFLFLALHLSHLSALHSVLRPRRRRPLHLVLSLRSESSGSQTHPRAKVSVRDSPDKRRLAGVHGRRSFLYDMCLVRPAVSVFEFERERQCASLVWSVTSSTSLSWCSILNENRTGSLPTFDPRCNRHLHAEYRQRYLSSPAPRPHLYIPREILAQPHRLPPPSPPQPTTCRRGGYHRSSYPCPGISPSLAGRDA